MQKILITGANGMLGQFLSKKISELNQIELYGVGRAKPALDVYQDFFEGDICSTDFIKKISKSDFYAVIHCAAITDLNLCEDAKELAVATHVTASAQLAEENQNAKFFYISTDSIFDNETAERNEETLPNPINNYALTKFQGGERVRAVHPYSYELRLNLYGFKVPFGPSLFEWAYQSLSSGIPIKGFSNVYFNPLYLGQIWEIIAYFMDDTIEYGIYNLGSTDRVSKYEFLQKIAAYLDLDQSLITDCEVDFSKSKVNRPYNTVLEIKKLQKKINNIDLSLDKGMEMIRRDLKLLNE